MYKIIIVLILMSMQSCLINEVYEELEDDGIVFVPENNKAS